MDDSALLALLKPYNPWWDTARWAADLPAYARPVVGAVLNDLREIPQIVSITGPRRVGKSTAVKQVIRALLEKGGVEARRALYFSFDDPQLVASQDLQKAIFDRLVDHMRGHGQPGYLFLDEVQRLPLWELFLKKHYDLKSPVRFVVSGSASSPIFRSSQESLLGRIKDRHLLPFSFREYCEYRLLDERGFAKTLNQHRQVRAALLHGDGAEAARLVNELDQALRPFWRQINAAVTDYCKDGGFPEVWALTDPVRKIEYLMEQQVRKVLYEDLMTLTQYRKPENVLRFFVYLLAHPGMEINTAVVARDTGVERRVVEENLPRLEMTDLILRVQRFSHKPLRVRQGNIKTYPIDMALRNAVMKSWDPMGASMGVYAENLVIRELVTWPEKIEVSYFREKNREVDFVLTLGGDHYLPIEVKSGQDVEDVSGLRLFVRKYGLRLGVVITTERTASFQDGLLRLPLRYFLLAC